jgi:hypothetical protein
VVAIVDRTSRACQSFSCRRRDSSAIGLPSCCAWITRSVHRLLRVVPAQIAGTPGENRRGVRRADVRAVCPPDCRRSCKTA